MLRLLVVGSALAGCTYYEIEPVKIPKPVTSEPTTTLEASFVTTNPSKINSAYWKTADYLPVTIQNQLTGKIPLADALLNMSGTYNGLNDFNLGKDPAVTMKAAYTNDSLYVLVSWKDAGYNASRANWFYNGPADPRKADSTTGWTSQNSDDNLYLTFPMGSGKSDLWNWSLALSEPLGFAIDMNDPGTGETVDAGDKMFERNAFGDNRSGPKFVWNEVQQDLKRTPGGATILDPASYLLNKKDFSGDIAKGEIYYQAECALCHGTAGDGNGTINPVGISLNRPGQFTRQTIQGLSEFAGGSHHEGAIHYPQTPAAKADLFARLLGFSGIPGYYLTNPSGSNSDVHAVSNVLLSKIDETNTKGYSVLFVRALNTGNPDDIQFTPATQATYEFGINLSSNDNLNRVGALNKQITFKTKP